MPGRKPGAEVIPSGVAFASLISPYTVDDVRVLGLLLLLLAWGAVQLPMAWCNQTGLHPEIPVGHDDHDHEDAHERVEIDYLVINHELATATPLIAAVVAPPLLRLLVLSAATPERAAAPPGRLTTVQLL